MNTDQFLNQRPCLEELEGFIHGLQGQGIEVPAAIYEYEKDLLKGKVTPTETKLNRDFTYQHRHKPKLNTKLGNANANIINIKSVDIGALLRAQCHQGPNQ